MYYHHRNVGYWQDHFCSCKYLVIKKMTQLFKNVQCINLDPAVKVIPYSPVIDIRETHDYKKVIIMTMIR